MSQESDPQSVSGSILLPTYCEPGTNKAPAFLELVVWQRYGHQLIATCENSLQAEVSAMKTGQGEPAGNADLVSGLGRASWRRGPLSRGGGDWALTG